MNINVSDITHWIIRADEPFRGHAQSFVVNGVVAYSGGLTPEQYAKERGFPVKMITDAELDAMVATHAETLKTDPEEVSEEVWMDALECLPPSRWHSHRGVNMFHCCEGITLDLVHWYARLNGRFYHFIDTKGASSEYLAAKVFEAIREN